MSGRTCGVAEDARVRERGRSRGRRTPRSAERRPRAPRAPRSRTRTCSSKSTPSSSAPCADLVAVDRGGEARLLELLLHRLRRQPVDPLRAHVGAGEQEAATARRRRRGSSPSACRGRRPGSRRARRCRARSSGSTSSCSSSASAPRVAGLEIGIALVVEVVEQADDAPELLVLAACARVGAHRGLDGQAVAAQRLGLDPLRQEGPGLVARKPHGHGCYPSRAADIPALRGPCPLMEKFVIEGGVPLSRHRRARRQQERRPADSRRLACSPSEEVVVRNVPRIRDVEAMLALLAASA